MAYSAPGSPSPIDATPLDSAPPMGAAASTAAAAGTTSSAAAPASSSFAPISSTTAVTGRDELAFSQAVAEAAATAASASACTADVAEEVRATEEDEQ